MLNTLWLKTWRDLWQNKGRSTLVILSIALSTFTLGVILNSYAILSREMTQDYLQSNPTAISFSIDKFSRSLLTKLELRAAIGKVDARRTVHAEIKTQSGQWQNLLLFVLNDYNDIKLDVLESEQGSWPPKDGEILIERQAMSVLGGQINDRVNIKTGAGFSTQLTIAGSTHDVGLAQAEWENIVYGYISEKTLTSIENSMGEQFYFNQLKVSLKDQNLSLEQMTEVAEGIQSWLTEQEYQVKRFNVAEVGEHPHANITGGMFMIQKVFALLCCLLSAVLVFNLMSAMLSKHIKQIGVMKALGASSKQISGIYYRGVIILGLTALAISLPSAIVVGNRYVDVLTPMMNFDINSYQVPFWILLIQIMLGIGIPLLSAYLPIKKASHMSIRETFIEYESSDQHAGQSWFSHLNLKLTFLSHPVRLALRNCVRQKGRFLLTTGVLMFAAALLMASFNIASTMNKVISVERESKNWGVEVKFQQALSDKNLQTLLKAVPDIIAVERFKRIGATIVEKDSIDVAKHDVNRGNDSGEGNKVKTHKVQVTLTDLKVNSEMLNHPLIDGRWFDKASTSSKINEIVISQMVLKHLPYLEIGMTIDIEILANTRPFKIVGIVQNIGMPSIYSNGYFTNKATLANGLYILANDHSEKTLKQLSVEIGEAAENNNMALSYKSTAWDGADVVAGHFDIIFSLMLLLTVIIIFIAANGILLTMTTNMLERTRETGVLKAIGASGRELMTMIFSEGCLMAVLAWLFACILTIPLSYGVAYWLGMLTIQTPFPLTLEPMIFIYTLPLMIMVTTLASLIPMLSITKQPIREALIYE